MEQPIKQNENQNQRSNKKKKKQWQIVFGGFLIVSVSALVALSGFAWSAIIQKSLPGTAVSEPESLIVEEPELLPESLPEMSPEPVDPCDGETIPAIFTAFQQAQANTDITFSVSYYNINEGCTFEYQAEQPFIAASTAKVAIALLSFEKIAEGFWSADTWITYDPDRHFESGAGPLQFDEAFTGATVAELLELMITQSDNVATNMLLSQLGWTVGTQEYISRITGIPPTDPQENLLSTHQHLLLMQHLLNPATPGHSEILLWMEQASDRTRLAAITNADGSQPVVAHKIGDYWDETGGYYHDVAYIQGENPYILVIMTHSMTSTRDDMYAQITSLGNQIQALHPDLQP